MPDYVTITLHQELDEIRTDVLEERKPGGSYAALADSFDDKILETIREGMEQAQKNSVAHSKDVESCRLRCKEKIDWVEKKLDEKQLDEKDFTAIKANLGLVKKYVDEMHVWRRDFASAMAKGFRGGWPEVAKKILSDAKLYAPFESKRKVMIDLDNKVSTLAARCDEYVPRAAEFLKQAVQREKGGKVEIAEFNADVETHQKSMEGHKAFIDDKILKARSAVTFFDNLDKKKEKQYVEDDRKLGTSWLATLERAAKECRGRLKTLLLEHDGLDKRARSAGPGWREKALKAVKDSDKICKEAKAASEGFDKTEEKARKLLEKVDKTLK